MNTIPEYWTTKSNLKLHNDHYNDEDDDDNDEVDDDDDDDDYTFYHLIIINICYIVPYSNMRTNIHHYMHCETKRLLFFFSSKNSAYNGGGAGILCIPVFRMM